MTQAMFLESIKQTWLHKYSYQTAQFVLKSRVRIMAQASARDKSKAKWVAVGAWIQRRNFTATKRMAQNLLAVAHCHHDQSQRSVVGLQHDDHCCRIQALSEC
jgi:hypothetical protein